MLIRADEQPAIEASEDAVVMRKLVDAAHTAGVSITHVRLSGVHRPLRTDHSTRIYYVLEGAGTFAVGDDPPVRAGEGDVVVIQPGVRYGFDGELTYLVLNAPAFVEGDDIYDEGA